MNAIERIALEQSFLVSTAVTAIVAAWLTFTFAATLGVALAGA